MILITDTAMDVVRDGRKMSEADEAEAKAMLSRFGIPDPEMKLLTMSGGQRKRAALASALLRTCEVLILSMIPPIMSGLPKVRKYA